jgi:hypothetical protein
MGMGGAGGMSAGGAGGMGMGGAGGMGMGGAGGMGMGGAGGGLPDCNDALANDFNLLQECEMCLADSCCTEVSECAVADNCPVCITGAEQCSVDAIDPAMNIVGCAQAQCQAECFDPPPPVFSLDCQAPMASPSGGSCVQVGGVFECNPITNAPCNTAGGEACDLNGSGVQCWGPPNTATLCQSCAQDYCAPGFTCQQDDDGNPKCAKYCCTDQDCSAAAHCDTTVFSAPFGICVE